MADIRTDKTPINVNEDIQNRTIRHMIFVQRFKTSEVRRIRKILDTEIIPALTAKIEARLKKIIDRGTDLGPATTARLKELERELLSLSKQMSEKIRAAVTVDLQALTKHELDWQVNTIKKSLGFDLELIVPNPRAIAALIKRSSFAGLTLDQWFDTLSRSTQKNVMIAVNRGVVEGQTTDQIVRAIRGTRALNFTDGVFQTTRNQAETVTRTVVNYTSNQSRIEFLNENSDVVDSLKWVATLDSRTSAICAGLDGKVFPVDSGPRPPAHPNCRSTMTAVLKDAESLGLKNIPEGMRASINGQVPESVTFGQWLKNQPVNVQNEVLGVSKAKLFRDGNLPIERFVDANLKPLTLEQLRQTEKKAFDRAGL